MFKRYLVAIAFVPMVALANPTVSKVAPTKINFNKNEQISVALSKDNINRVFVKGDKIVSINAPDGFLTATNDPSGSAYVNVLYPRTFSAFVSTLSGNHFSMLVLPRSEPGQTVELISNGGNSTAKHWEKSSSYQVLLIKLIKDVLNNKTPDGYDYTQIKQSKPYESYRFRGAYYLIPQGVFTGDKLAVKVFLADNRSDYPVKIIPNELYGPGVRAIATTSQSLAPHAQTKVYEVIDNV